MAGWIVKFWSSGLLRDTIPRFERTNATASLAIVLAHLDKSCHLAFHGSSTLPRDSSPLRSCTATTCGSAGFMFAHLNPPSDRPASPILLPKSTSRPPNKRPEMEVRSDENLPSHGLSVASALGIEPTTAQVGGCGTVKNTEANTCQDAKARRFRCRIQISRAHCRAGECEQGKSIRERRLEAAQCLGTACCRRMHI